MKFPGLVSNSCRASGYLSRKAVREGCFRRKPWFPSQRRIARQLWRDVGVILFDAREILQHLNVQVGRSRRLEFGLRHHAAVLFNNRRVGILRERRRSKASDHRGDCQQKPVFLMICPLVDVRPSGHAG